MALEREDSAMPDTGRAGLDGGRMAPSEASRSSRLVIAVVLVAAVIVVAVVVANVLLSSGQGESSFDTTPPIDDLGNAQGTFFSMPLGQNFETDGGLSVNAGAVQENVSVGGATFTTVTVTYANGGATAISYAPGDWRAESPDGAALDPGQPAGAPDALAAGTLDPGQTVTARLYFQTAPRAVYYFEADSTTPTASWHLPQSTG